MDRESSSSGQESLLNTCSNEISPDHLFVATKYFRKMQLEWMHRITRYKQGNRTAKKIKILKIQGPKIQPEAQNTITNMTKLPQTIMHFPENKYL
jgi:hypothetical protein